MFFNFEKLKKSDLVITYLIGLGLPLSCLTATVVFNINLNTEGLGYLLSLILCLNGAFEHTQKRTINAFVYLWYSLMIMLSTTILMPISDTLESSKFFY